MRKLFSPLVALGLVAALLATAPQAQAEEPTVTPTVSAAAFTPPAGIIFNNPIGSADQQFAIMNHLVKSVNSVPTGSTIRIAVYSFSYTPLADALVAAFNRGVVVKLIIDDHARPRTKENTRLRALLNKTTTDASFVATCEYGCMSSKPSFMHAKIYQFSRAGNASYVTMAASANPAYGAATASWNNIWTTLNDKVTYDSNVKYFNDMKKDKTNTNYYRTTTSGNLTTYFFPRGGKTPATDTLYTELGQINCATRTAAGYGTADGRTIVRVSAYFWTSLRAYIATRLAAMQRAGCDVQVIYPADTIDKAVPKALLGAGIPTWNTRIDINGDKQVDLYVHSKYVSINGIYRGKNDKVVFTGAPNFTNNSLRQSNENMVRIYDDATTMAFQNNFAVMRDTASEPVTKASAKAMHADSVDGATEAKRQDTAPDPDDQ